MSEGEVQRHVRNWLDEQGWTTKIAVGWQHGVDINAARGTERWLIEAKGCGSSDPMRRTYFQAVLGQILQRMDDPKAKYSIAFPKIQQFQNLWLRFPAEAKRRCIITALFVNVDGAIDEVP